jgi:hypothetical protein
VQIAIEAAGFERDVLAALRPLPRLSLAIVPLGSVQATAFECVDGGKQLGPSANGTLFARNMIEAVPTLYGAADVLWAHPYPACGDNPWSDWCARGWLEAYKDMQATVSASWHTNADHNATALIPVLVTETGWQAPQNETGKALWMVQAYQQLFLPDPTVLGVMPFLLAGPMWQSAGFPWSVWSPDGSLLEALQPQFVAIQEMARSG